MMNDILSWNKSLFLLLNGSDSLYMDGVMWTVTKTVTWVPLMLLLVYIIIKNNPWRNSLLTLATLALLIVITDQTASGAAVFLSLIFRSWTASCVLYCYATLCSYSRIYLGVHTPIDILVGIVFGTLAGVMMYLLYCYLSGKLATQHTYYSSAYTSNGYRRSDFLLVVLFLALTLLYVSFNAIRLASQF